MEDTKRVTVGKREVGEVLISKFLVRHATCVFGR